MKLQFHLPSLIEFVKYDDDDSVVETKILRAQRPILKIRSIFPHELDAVVTIEVMGRYHRASVLKMIIIDENGKTLARDFLHSYMSKEEFQRYIDDMGTYPLKYPVVPRDLIYEYIKGTTVELIKDFYDIQRSSIDQRVFRNHYVLDDTHTIRVKYVREFVGIDPELSDERFYKHFNLNTKSIEDFERNVAKTTEFIWRESLLPR